MNTMSDLINPTDQYIVWLHLNYSENWVPFGQETWYDVIDFLKSSSNRGDNFIITRPVKLVEG